jgi:hypothetical protein
VLVGLVASWWLRKGEAAASGLLRGLAAYATAPVRLLFWTPTVPEAPAQVRLSQTEGPTPTEAVVRLYVVRRGPPEPALAW